MGLNPFAGLLEFNYTCLAPAEENETLNDVPLAKQLSSALLSKFAVFKDKMNQIIDEKCKLYPLPNCKEELRKAIIDVSDVSPFVGIPECKKFTDKEIEDHCA